MSLFKYLPVERLDVVRNGTIRFTQAGALNDPFELKPYFGEVIAKDRLVEELVNRSMDLGPHLREAYDGLPAEARALISYDQMVAMISASPEAVSSAVGESLRLFFSEYDRHMPAMKMKFYDRLRSDFGILSLTEAANNVLMWSHYASEHRGFLLQFDEAHPFFNQRRGPEDEFYHLRRVNYANRQVFKDLMDLNGDDLLLAKGPQWEYEREWRMILPLPLVGQPLVTPEGDAVYLVPFPPEAISGVVLGGAMTPAVRDELLGVLAEGERYRHVAVYEAVLNEITGGVNVHPYDGVRK